MSTSICMVGHRFNCSTHQALVMGMSVCRDSTARLRIRPASSWRPHRSVIPCRPGAMSSHKALYGPHQVCSKHSKRAQTCIQRRSLPYRLEFLVPIRSGRNGGPGVSQPTDTACCSVAQRICTLWREEAKTSSFDGKWSATLRESAFTHSSQFSNHPPPDRQGSLPRNARRRIKRHGHDNCISNVLRKYLSIVIVIIRLLLASPESRGETTTLRKNRDETSWLMRASEVDAGDRRRMPLSIQHPASCKQQYALAEVASSVALVSTGGQWSAVANTILMG
ncbi:hypothetical protein LIA77_10977 [Sarocladium implicatum]|nr:hypothetical protein LIA77_10977 [Sarocladium implicatum]